MTPIAVKATCHNDRKAPATRDLPTPLVVTESVRLLLRCCDGGI